MTLLAHLQTPLREEEKVPITQEEFRRLVTIYSPDSPKAELKAKQVATLFRISDKEDAPAIFGALWTALRVSPPLTGSEAIFHSTWDANISEIIKTILIEGHAIRDSNHNTNTALKRPDYGFLVKKHCLFRGEEKHAESMDNPKKELLDKLVDFPYEPLEFILGPSICCYQTNAHFFIPRVLCVWRPC
jgi:hypothetical protein